MTALFGLVSNPGPAGAARHGCCRWLFYLAVPWSLAAHGRAAGRVACLVAPWLAPLAHAGPSCSSPSAAGGLEGRFGTGYGAIGWHKPLRNLLNVPLVLLIGLGLPAFLCLLPGLRALWRTATADRPLAGRCCRCSAFALYMLFTGSGDLLPSLSAAAAGRLHRRRAWGVCAAGAAAASCRGTAAARSGRGCWPGTW
jgi:hypothetical protein